MKVVQINVVSGKGSTGVIAKNISCELNKHNVENYILYAKGHDDYEKAFKISDIPDMKIHALLSHLTGLQGYFSFFHTMRMLKIIKNIEPDVVHLHNLHNNYVNLGMLFGFLKKKKIKTVLTLHDCWFFTGKCTHFSFEKCYKWKTGCHNCTQLKKDNASWFFDFTKKQWKDKKYWFEGLDDLEVVGVSDWISNLAKRSILRCGRISTIHNGIDTYIFSDQGSDLREKYGLDDKFVIMGMANKWLSDINSGVLDRLIYDMEDRFHFLIIGEKGVSTDRVTYVDFVESPQYLAQLYRTADVFINLTHEDSLPSVNIEAMSCGTPVITYDVCGSSEIVTEKTGEVVKEWDHMALKDAIRKVYVNGKQYYSNNCRKHIEENYDMRQFGFYYDLYKSNI